MLVMVHNGAGVRLSISREAAEQVSGVTCGIGLSRRAKGLLSLPGAEKGWARKVISVVIHDPKDLLPQTEVEDLVPKSSARLFDVPQSLHKPEWLVSWRSRFTVLSKRMALIKEKRRQFSDLENLLVLSPRSRKHT